MIFTEAQANELFDILLRNGGYHDSITKPDMVDFWRGEFVSNHTRSESKYENWHSSTNGSNVKLYYYGYGPQPIRAHLQTTAVKDKNLEAELNAELASFVARETEKANAEHAAKLLDEDLTAREEALARDI